jgi:hypothetical protein
MEIEITAEQIAKHYSAAMDSVNLINGTKPELMTDADWADCLSRNKEHLKIMLAKDFWTTDRQVQNFMWYQAPVKIK